MPKSNKKVIGRPRKPLIGGHKNRRPRPTEDAQINAHVRTMTSPRKTVPVQHVASDDPGWERDAQGRRVFRLKKGHHIGKHGSPRVPKTVRASVASILKSVVGKNKPTIAQAVLGGIASGPTHADRYIRLAAEYVDGKPVDTVHLHAQYAASELDSARAMLGAKLDTMLTSLVANKARSKK